MNNHRNETASHFFRRIHVKRIIVGDMGIRIDYMRTPRGYGADCEWLFFGTFNLEA